MPALCRVPPLLMCPHLSCPAARYFFRLHLSAFQFIAMLNFAAVLTIFVSTILDSQPHVTGISRHVGRIATAMLTALFLPCPAS